MNHHHEVLNSSTAPASLRDPQTEGLCLSADAEGLRVRRRVKAMSDQLRTTASDVSSGQLIDVASSCAGASAATLRLTAAGRH